MWTDRYDQPYMHSFPELHAKNAEKLKSEPLSHAIHLNARAYEHNGKIYLCM
jgi:hypothetical protein